ncbi:MAG TPA: zf-HC2 domain-containing protein [Myxococcaceae bacterium]|nr:zf-HC2 domain-containing protein [Myxococcaceae bacterium]
MLRCKELTELVTDHLERQLPLALRISVSLHLSSCRHCRAYFGQMKSLVKMLRLLAAESDPPEVSDKLLLSFRRRHRARQVSRHRSDGALRLLPLNQA